MVCRFVITDLLCQKSANGNNLVMIVEFTGQFAGKFGLRPESKSQKSSICAFDFVLGVMGV